MINHSYTQYILCTIVSGLLHTATSPMLSPTLFVNKKQKILIFEYPEETSLKKHAEISSFLFTTLLPEIKKENIPYTFIGKENIKPNCDQEKSVIFIPETKSSDIQNNLTTLGYVQKINSPKPKRPDAPTKDETELIGRKILIAWEEFKK